MKQYLDLLEKILTHGVEKESGRVNMPNTIGISNGIIEMDLADGFPLLTTKKMYWKGIVHELLWFLKGDTNIKYLVDNNVNIWNKDAYRWYLKKIEEHNENNEEKIGGANFKNFIKDIKEGLDHKINNYKLGDLGKIYGYQWRNQNGVDQIKEVIDGLKHNPYSRYHIIDGWNKADFKDMALPPCHLLYQFIVRPLGQGQKNVWVMNNCDIEMENLAIVEETYKSTTPQFYLDLNMYQRSCDTFLGVPFNIASMSLLLKIISQAVGMISGVATWIGGDTHLYKDHIPAVREQLKRIPFVKPKLTINKELNSLEDIETLMIDDFTLEHYNSYNSIKAELFTGLKNNKNKETGK